MLKTGAGGIDWSGLPLLVAWLGIADLDGLLDRLCVILVHRPQKEI